ncbi:MAG: hypothetical protein ACR2L2_16395 [Acidobacteriota bacterium]
MKRKRDRQYTVRGVTSRVDEALRKRAQQQEKSLNEVTLEALASAVGLAEERPLYHDLDGLAETWVSDPEFDQAIEMQDQVDPAAWK